jgi:hypothetical protein
MWTNLHAAARASQMPNIQAAEKEKSVTLHDAEKDISVVLADPDSQGWRELRDRAAYVYLSGSFPSHLRPHTVRALRQVVHPVNHPEEGKALVVNDEAVDALQLREHPMVTTANRFLEKGYQLRLSDEPGDRRPFSRVLVYREVGEGIQKATISIDGGVKSGWH